MRPGPGTLMRVRTVAPVGRAAWMEKTLEGVAGVEGVEPDAEVAACGAAAVVTAADAAEGPTLELPRLALAVKV